MEGSVSTLRLGQPITDRGLRSVNFFNGRLLAAEDLRSEQESGERARSQIGRAIGEGIVHGFEVSTSPDSSRTSPVLTVQPGLAINREGALLELTARTDVALVDSTAPSGAVEAQAFVACEAPGPAAFATGSAVYLFTAAPAREARGRAPVSGLGNEAAACNSDYLLEGVAFGLFPLNLSAALLADRPRLRNRVAHLVYGTTDPRRWEAEFDALSPAPPAYGLLDDLRAVCLTDRQVPLALLFWTTQGGIEFLDLWSVRRRTVRPFAAARWPTLLGDRVVAETEAMLLQFQDQITDLTLAGADLRTIAAADVFDFLPPVGMVPISAATPFPGFDRDGFLGDQGSSQVSLTDGTHLHSMVQESLFHRPIAVGIGKERIQRYFVYESVLAAERGAAARLVMVFAKESLSHRGVARFGYAHFGWDRFAPAVI